MPISYLHYDLQQGYIHNWLTGGPQAIPVDGPHPAVSLENKAEILRQFRDPDLGIKEIPVERGPLTKGIFKIGDYEGSWSYVACQPDHLVDQTTDCPSLTYLRAWSYAQLKCLKPRLILLSLVTQTPADVWLNGKLIFHQEQFNESLQSYLLPNITLRGGVNKLFVRCETVGLGECPLMFALRVCHQPENGNQTLAPASDVYVRLPTLIEDLDRRNQLERSFYATYTDRNIYSQKKVISLHWAKDLDLAAQATVRLQTPEGKIYAQADVEGLPGDTLKLNHTEQIPDGPYEIFMLPRHWEYYNQDLRFTRTIRHLWSLGSQRFSEFPYGSLEERKQEALKYAARYNQNVFGEIAKLKLGRWGELDNRPIQNTIQMINQAADNHLLYLVAVLGLYQRFGQHTEFPAALRSVLEDCFRNYRFYQYQSPENEAQQILGSTAQILAGQLMPEHTFADGHNGEWHRQTGEGLALEWMVARGQAGFAEWDSPDTFMGELTALSHLVDLSMTEQIWEMATVVMDKLFLTIAMNSYKGVFGSTQGRASASSIGGGLLQATSGISRLMWGMGIFNHHLAGVVSLACLEQYELPPIIERIAADQLPEFLNRERHLANGEINKVTYKTPDYMLCSVQDYQAGQKGHLQHVWQATLGSEACVFVNHPAHLEEHQSNPGNWLGNAVLPRIAQWKDTLVAIHRLPDQDWLGFTHAYFPIYAFDEYQLRAGWAFARKANGYLALTAADGLELIESGENALRELRSPGQHNVWVCQMGRSALDGDFAAFQDKILATSINFQGLAVQYQTLRGDHLSFGWEGPLKINNTEQPLAGYPHYDNLYTSVDLFVEQMEMHFGAGTPSDEMVLRLDFSLEADAGDPDESS